jgi:hypothetical protein
MTLPSNIRSLFVFGAFCVVGGAWLTLAAGIRTLPLRDTNAASAIEGSMSGSASNRIDTGYCAGQ